MDVRNLNDARSWFEVLQTEPQAQTAVMKLEPGGASGETLNSHAQSAQVLLVVEGEVEAEVGGDQQTLHVGDVVVIPPGVPHRFRNRSAAPVLTFNVYAPPEYPA